MVGVVTFRWNCVINKITIFIWRNLSKSTNYSDQRKEEVDRWVKIWCSSRKSGKIHDLSSAQKQIETIASNKIEKDILIVESE